MPRHIRYGIIVFAVLLAGGSFYYYDLQQRIRDLVRRQQETPHPYVVNNPDIPTTAPTRKVRLFFPSTHQDGLLEVEEREIHRSPQLTIEAKQIVAELIRGSHEGYGPVLPAQTLLREIYLAEEGLLYVDLTSDAGENHPGGLTREVSTVYSIVNSLCENLPDVRKVQILLEGAEAETLAGHVDLSQPFLQDLSMTSLAK
jgi:spore germination protein GerM